MIKLGAKGKWQTKLLGKISRFLHRFWLPATQEHTLEETTHQNSKDRNVPITNIENQPIRAHHFVLQGDK